MYINIIGPSATSAHTLENEFSMGVTHYSQSVGDFTSNEPSTSYGHVNEDLPFESAVEQNRYDMIKSKKRKIRIQDEFSDHYSSDEEFIPYPDEVSDELTDEDDNLLHTERRTNLHATVNKTKKLKKNHKKLQATLKSKKITKPKRCIDDGDVKVYHERMRILRLKEKLRSTQTLNGVSDSEISEEEANDRKEISLNRGFTLPVKFWRKLYK